MDYRILGPLDVRAGGVRIAPGRGRQRALLAVLLLHANETVVAESLVEELWDGTPPPSATKIVQNYVSRLRRELGDGRLLTRGRGYELRVEPGELDVDRFRCELEAGRRALGSGDPELATATLGAALALWRGPALADFSDERFAHAEIDRLEDLRLAALTERIEADLTLGKHAELIGELEALATRHPFQERLCGQRMLALYRAGRQAEALEVYREMRRSLVDELGIEPGRSLQALERSILTQDPGLDYRPRAVRERTARGGGLRRPGRAVTAGVAAAAVLGAVLVGIVFDRGGAVNTTAGSAYSIAMVDPRSNTVTGQMTVGLLPSAIATGAGYVWVLNQGETTVSVLDPATRRVTRTIGLQGPSNENVGASGLAFADGSVLVGDGNAGTLIRLYPNGGSDYQIRVHPRAENDVLLLATGHHAVWAVSVRRATVYRVEPVTHDVSARARVPATPVGVAVGRRAVWVASVRPANRIPGVATSGALTRIEPSTGAVVATRPLPFAPSGVALGFGAVWVTLNSQNAVLRIDPRTNAVEQVVGVGEGPTGITASGNSLWVVNTKSQTISRIDPATNRVVATIPVSGTPGAIAAGFDRIWVTGA